MGCFLGEYPSQTYTFSVYYHCSGGKCWLIVGSHIASLHQNQVSILFVFYFFFVFVVLTPSGTFRRYFTVCNWSNIHTHKRLYWNWINHKKEQIQWEYCLWWMENDIRSIDVCKFNRSYLWIKCSLQQFLCEVQLLTEERHWSELREWQYLQMVNSHWIYTDEFIKSTDIKTAYLDHNRFLVHLIFFCKIQLTHMGKERGVVEQWYPINEEVVVTSGALFTNGD